VLGGGGFTGGVYEMGALRALNLLSVNRTVSDFDVYVGTSAGAFVAALTANGVTPEQMMRVVNNQGPGPFRDVSLDMLLRPNYREYALRALQLPFALAGLTRTIGRSLSSFSPVDLGIALAEALPSGHLHRLGHRAVLRTVLADRAARTTSAARHGALPRRADLDTCERIILGAEAGTTSRSRRPCALARCRWSTRR
jgi:hypothetical protein